MPRSRRRLPARKTVAEGVENVTGGDASERRPRPLYSGRQPAVAPGFYSPGLDVRMDALILARSAVGTVAETPVAPAADDVVVGTSAAPPSSLAEAVMMVVRDAPKSCQRDGW